MRVSLWIPVIDKNPWLEEAAFLWMEMYRQSCGWWRLSAGLPNLEGKGGFNSAACGSKGGQVWGEEDAVPQSWLLGSQMRWCLNLMPEPAGHGGGQKLEETHQPGNRRWRDGQHRSRGLDGMKEVESSCLPVKWSPWQRVSLSRASSSHVTSTRNRGLIKGKGVERGL